MRPRWASSSNGDRGAPSLTLSPCLEWLFADGDRKFPERVHAAAAAGFAQVEFWTTTDKDVQQVEVALRETSVVVTCFVSEPTGQLVDRETHAAFQQGVERSTELAARLGARGLIVVSGNTRAGVERSSQREAVTEALIRAAPIASRSGVRLLLEPLNSRVDHPGYYLDSTAEALEIIEDVAHPAVMLLYDLYHSIVMGEDPAQVLAGSGHLIGHVHVADVPGRREPGTGIVDWPRQFWALRSAGYSGPIGLEFRPSWDTESSLEYVRRITT